MARCSWFGLVLVGALGVAGGLALAPWKLWGQQPRSAIGLPANDLIVLPGAASAAGQQVIVVDTVNRVMGAYTVNEQSGEIALKSVRNFSWDLYLEHFNAAQPAPGDIKQLLEKNR
jgi:hypothetical protein